MNSERMATRLNSASSFSAHKNSDSQTSKISPVINRNRKKMPGFYKLILHLAVACVLMRTIYAAKFELEPSQQLLGNERHFTEMQKDSFTEFDIGDLTLDNVNPDGRKSMRLVAVVGQLFNRSITEELKRFDSNLVEPDSFIKVHFPASLLGSEWLLYKEHSSLIQGVPLPENEGIHNIYIMITKSESYSAPTLTLPCRIDVISEEELYDSAQDHSEIIRSLSISDCPKEEPLTAASITLNVQPNVLFVNERIHCIQALAAFLGVPCETVKLHTTEKSRKNDRAFLSGPGNVRKQPKNLNVDNVVSLSWPIGCSSDINGQIPGLAVLEETAAGGTLAKAIGYGVSEWKILNRAVQLRALKRRKRQLDQRRPKSAVISHPRASRLPSGTFDEMELDQTNQSEGKKKSRKIRPGRTKVRHDKIQRTPVPVVVAASKLVISPHHTAAVVLPSTPVIPMIAASISPEPSISSEPNTAPMVMFGVENLKVRVGAYMEYRIPDDAFYDTEEGGTRNLNLEVLDTDSNSYITTSGTWPLFDAKAQLIYGVPPEQTKPSKEYMITAKDNEGKSNTILFLIEVAKKGKARPYSHKFTLYFMDSSGDQEEYDSDAFFSSFGRKLSVALAKTQSQSGKLTMLETGIIRDGELRYVKWFDGDLNNEHSCQKQDILNEAKLMAGPDFTGGKNKPLKEFQNKFKPEYKVKSLKVEFIGPCTIRDRVTTTPPVDSTDEHPSPPLIPSPPPRVTGKPKTTSKPTSTTEPTSKNDKTTSTKKPGVTTPSSENGMKPKIVKKIPQIRLQLGKVLEFSIPSGIFEDEKDPESDLKLRLVEWGDGIPPWIGFDSTKRELFANPLRSDFDKLEMYNSTHKFWKGGLEATNNNDVTSGRALIELFVPVGTVDEAEKSNHIFRLQISNYNLEDFTSSDRRRLIRVIYQIFGDTNADSIYVQSMEEGSVMVSWHNSSLSHVDPCPYDKIAFLTSKIFADKSIKAEVKSKFESNGFTFTLFNCTRTKWCKITTEFESTTTVSTVVVGGAKSTGVMIIAIVVVCLVLLIVILVVKCRMGKSSKAKKEQRKRLEEATIGASEMAASPRIKKGVPIIFQDEIAMGTNGEAHTPLVPCNGSRQYGNNNNDRSPAITTSDENILEETPFTQRTHQHITPPTPILSDRPPPPYNTHR